MTRKTPYRRGLAALAFAALCATGAATALGQGIYEPVALKEKEQTLIDTSGELYGYFERRSVLYGDPKTVALVAGIGRSLAPAPTDSYIQYRFFVLRDPSPNAFALPNGDVYVHTGMLARLADDAQLAAVLGHEVNHVAGHHSIVDFRSSNKKMVAGMVLTGVLGGFGGLISTGLYASMYGFNRELEQEADDRAVEALRNSPYDSRALPEIYELLADDYEGVQPRTPTLWSTHPQLEARAERTRGQVANDAKGARDATGFDAIVLPIRTMTVRDYIQDDYPRTAVALSEDLAKRYPDDPQFLGLLGDSWQAMGPRAVFDEDELSNAQKRRNATRRVTRTRQEREAALLETEEGKTALVANVSRARDAYGRALALDSGFAPALRGLGECAERVSEPRVAAQAYVDYLKAAPNADDRAVVLERLRKLRDVLRSEGANDVAKAD